jgi:hypothetical protein
LSNLHYWEIENICRYFDERAGYLIDAYGDKAAVNIFLAALIERTAGVISMFDDKEMQKKVIENFFQEMVKQLNTRNDERDAG